MVARDDRRRGARPAAAFSTLDPDRGRRLASFPGTRYGDIYHPVAAPETRSGSPPRPRRLWPSASGSAAGWSLGRVDADCRVVARAGPWPAQLSAVPHPAEALPYIELNGSSWEEYLAGRSRQFRSQVGRKMRWLRREHEVRIRRPGIRRGGAWATSAPCSSCTTRAGPGVTSSRRSRTRGPASSIGGSWSRRSSAGGFGYTCSRWTRPRSPVGTDGEWATASPTTRPGSIRPGGSTASAFCCLRRPSRRRSRREPPSTTFCWGRAIQGAFRDRKRLGRSVLLAPRLSRPRLRASARAWVARRRAARRRIRARGRARARPA